MRRRVAQVLKFGVAGVLAFLSDYGVLMLPSQGLRMIASLFKDYKPFPFFGILCLISLVISLCLGVPVVGEFMATRVVARFPTAILAVAFAGLSALFLVCGILLDTIVKANRRQWEIDCYRAFDEERERRERRGKGDC